MRRKARWRRTKENVNICGLLCNDDGGEKMGWRLCLLSLVVEDDESELSRLEEWCRLLMN
eukprot:738341-Hanusia_phi.AAC.3